MPISADIARRARSARPVAVVAEGRVKTRADIREAMSGNICRCGAYTNIVDAIEDVIGHAAADGRLQEKVQVTA